MQVIGNMAAFPFLCGENGGHQLRELLFSLSKSQQQGFPLLFALVGENGCGDKVSDDLKSDFILFTHPCDRSILEGNDRSAILACHGIIGNCLMVFRQRTQTNCHAAAKAANQSGDISDRPR